MPTYDEAKLNAFTAATTVTVVGVPLDVSDDHPLRREGYRAIKGCICVTEPCPCDEESSEILWIFSPRGDARGIATDKKNEAGEVLYNFRLDADVTVVIESYERIRVSDLISTRRRMHSRSNTRDRITMPKRLDIDLQPGAARGGCAKYKTFEVNGEWAVYVLIGEEEVAPGKYACAYHYHSGMV